MYCMHSQKDTKVHRQLIRTSKVKSSSRMKCIGTKSGDPFCFLQYGFLSATLGVPRPVLPQRTFSSAWKRKKQLFCFPTRRAALTTLSMKIRRPSKSKMEASKFSDNSMGGQLVWGNFSLGQAMFRIVWSELNHLFHFPTAAGRTTRERCSDDELDGLSHCERHRSAWQNDSNWITQPVTEQKLNRSRVQWKRFC